MATLLFLHQRSENSAKILTDTNEEIGFAIPIGDLLTAFHRFEVICLEIEQRRGSIQAAATFKMQI